MNDRERSPYWLNNYLTVERLSRNNEVTIEFPMVETTEKYREASYAREYTCQFKGNTLVDVAPRAQRPEWKQSSSDDGSQFKGNLGYPIYLVDHYKW